MSSLAELIKKKNKEAKSDLLSIGVEPIEYTNKVPLTSPSLNHMLYGGLPKYRIIEFAGAENSGKTTTSLDAIGCFQRQAEEGKYCCFVDVENTFNTAWATLLGVDLEKLVLLRIENQTAEQIMNLIDEVIETGEIELLVVDSIAVMIPQSVYAKGYDEKNYGGNAQALARFTNKLAGKLTQYKSTCILINQVREDLDNPYNQYKTPGGCGLKHNESLRLMFKKGQMFDEEGKEVKQSFENPQSHKVMCHLLKTKVFAPNRKLGSYTLHYRNGIDWVSDLVDTAILYNLISKTSAWYELFNENGEQLVKLQGILKVKEYILGNEEYQKALLLQVNSLVDKDN